MAPDQPAALVLVGVATSSFIYELNNFDAWLRDVALVPPEGLDSLHMLPATRGGQTPGESRFQHAFCLKRPLRQSLK